MHDDRSVGVLCFVRASVRSCDGESGEAVLASDRVTGNTNVNARLICCA